MSTMPGASVRPRASTRSRAGPRSPPTAAMRPPSTATPPGRGGPPRPSTTTASSITRSCTAGLLAVHDEAAVDAQRLAGHVAGARRGEEADHGGDVFGAFHPPQRYRLLALAGELLRRLVEQRALLAGDLVPHVGLDEARTHAVEADAVGGVGECQALGHADDGGLADVVGQVGAAADLAGHRRQADDAAALLREHGRQHRLAR